ncbi:MAG: LamG-like jellyroll fold domain-containing protein [bacterium]
MLTLLEKIRIVFKKCFDAFTFYFFTKKITIIKWQLNIFAIVCIGLGLTVGGIGILPKILAANETNFNIQQGGSSDFTAGSANGVIATTTSISLGKDSNWYNLNWNYKRPLTIKNTSASTINANSPISISIDTTALESVLANCNDIRIVYQNTTELALTIKKENGSTGCNDSKITQLTFPLQANLASSSTDSTNYFLYYGNSGASSQGSNGYSIQSGPVASMVCSFNGSSTCETGQTPSTESGAIRYSTKSAISFDGINDNINVGKQSSINNIHNLITVNTWVKFNPIANGASFTIYVKRNDSFTIYNNGSVNRIRANINGGGNSIGTTAMNPNTWYMVTYTYNDSTDRVTHLFVNGVEETLTSNNPGSGTIQDDSPYDMTIGGTANFFNGQIDEFSMYNRILSSQELLALYNSGNGKVVIPDSNTKLLYHFDENGDDPRNTGKAIDSSGNGNNGTISGAKYVGGIIGIDASSADSGKLNNQSYASHSGVMIEEGTTNLITNPSFENASYATNWGTNYMTYSAGSSTYTPNMSKRTPPAGPFVAAPIVQGNMDGTGIPDSLTASQGSQISGNFYQNFDSTQGSIVFWITPEWNGNDNVDHFILSNTTTGIRKYSDNRLYFYSKNAGGSQYVDVSAWTAGSTHLVIARWDNKNNLNGSNPASLTIDNVTTFMIGNGSEVAPTTLTIGSRNDNTFPADAIIQGLTIYRRVLYEATTPSGINIGNGDELSQIYAAGAGKDPSQITGSWDIVFALPTNSSTGTLASGTGNAWSHPHSSNLLYTSTTNTGGYMMNGTASNDGFTAISQTPWYLAGGVSAGNVVAAYQPYNASSLANSYINLANPGTNNASVGVAPTWDSVNGWTFNGTSNYLKTGIIPTDSSTVIVSYTGYAGTASTTIIGTWGTGSLLMQSYNTGMNSYHGTTSFSGVNTPVLTAGTYAVAGKTPYRNGIAEPTTIVAGTGSGYTELYIAALNISGSPAQYSNIKIQSIAIYNSTLSAPQIAAVSAAMGNLSSSFNVTSLATSEKIYPGGYKYTTTGIGQGIYNTFTATNGGNYVLRALGNSDGTCTPQVKVTRADGTTEISHLTGTKTSTRASPDIYIFTWTSPAAESEQVQLINTVATGTCYWHQVEVLPNLMSSPSMESGTGDPLLPTGWDGWINTLPAGSTSLSSSIVHSGQYSLKLAISGASSSNCIMPTRPASTSGNFYDFGMYAYANSGVINKYWSSKYILNSGSNSTTLTTSGTGSWSLLKGVYRYASSGFNDHRLTATDGYADDMYYFTLDNISLTVTPASQANSGESTGLRVDGGDTLTQAVSSMSTTSGSIKFKFTPRHSAANAIKFADGVPPRILYISDGTANNEIHLYFSVANVLTLKYVMNGVSNTATYDANAVGDFAAGATYVIGVRYSGGGNMIVSVNGVDRITATSIPASFSSALTTAYLGSYMGGIRQIDGTYISFYSASMTQNSVAPYYKFGSNSMALNYGGSYTDEVTTNINVGNTGTNTLSGYVYDGTAGNVGGIVSNTIAELYFNTSTIATTYTDMGGGWWRLTGSLTGVNQAALYGVQIKSNKIIYVDGVQLEAKAYATSYVDGSLGPGYTWSGTENNSTSIRTAGDIVYPSAGNISASSGSISAWIWFPSYYVGCTGAHAGILDTSGANYIHFGQDCGSAGIEIRGTGGSGAFTSLPTYGQGKWHNWVGTWNGTLLSFYLDGVFKVSNSYSVVPTVSSIILSRGISSNTTRMLSDLRVFNQALTSTQISDLYNQSLTNYSQSTTDQRKYTTTGTWESPVINLNSNAMWGTSPNFVTTESLNGNTVSYDVRTSPDANTWTNYTANSGTSPNYNINALAQKYIQIKATLNSASQITSPSISTMSVHYVEDNTPPTTNAANTSMKTTAQGRSVSETGWTNDQSPYFRWDLGVDNVGGSGIKGYCLSLSGTQADDPTSVKGILGTSPVSTIGMPCQFIVGTNEIDFSDLSLRGNTWLTTSNNPYYLNIKALDNAGNTFPTSETFEFKYDDLPPTNVASFSTPQNSFSNVDDIYFNWPTSGNSGASDNNSQLLGYEYSINSESNWTGSNTSASLGVKYIPVGDSQPYYLSVANDSSRIQMGNNTIYFRALDNAGNLSTISRTASISYGGEAPKFADGSSITVTPSVSSTNSFSLSWPVAVPSVGRSLKSYYYMINTTPPNLLSTILSNSTIYIPTTSTSIPEGKLVGAVKGQNRVYVVAIDDLNNYSGSNGLSKTFTLNSTLPDPAINLRVADTSIKSVSLWSVSLAWNEPIYKGTGALSYEVDRSENGTSWTKVIETNGTAFVDVVPLSKKYYYRVGSMDNTDESKASPSYSLSVSITPKGAYTVPAELVSSPVTSNITTRRATISWVTARNSDSRIVYGLTQGEYFPDDTGNSKQVTEHVTNLTNLLPSTTYYYKARWTDEDGNLGESTEQSFETLPAPSVKDVTVVNVGTNSARIQFTSIGANKVKIYYGKSTQFGGLQELPTSNNESKYMVILDGLDDGTKYYYRVNPFDIENTEYEGTVLDFKTLPRPRVSSVKLQQVKNTAETSIIISWQSNTEVSSIVTYYPDGKASQSRDTVNLALISGEHKITLSGLKADTLYNLIVKGQDRIGNEARSDIVKFTTASDTRPPVITDMLVESVAENTANSSTGKAQIIVSWNTDEPATSAVEFGEGYSDTYPSKSITDFNLTSNHMVVISNLEPSKVYHFRAVSKDKAENTGISSNTVAITTKASTDATNLLLDSLRNLFNF